MTRGETDRKLREMKMSVMANEYYRQATDNLVQKLPFDDRFQMIIDLEYAERSKRKLTRLLKQSGIMFRDACISDVYYGEERNLQRPTVERYGSCKFITEGRSILLMGPTGCGKSYLASALGIEACKRGHSVRYVSMEDLLADINAAGTDARLSKRVMKHYRNPDLLIIDEFLRWKLSSSDANCLFRIIDFRSANKKPVIVCSQYPCDSWISQFEDPIDADAIVDRLIHTPYKVFINEDGSGKSMREVFSGA